MNWIFFGIGSLLFILGIMLYSTMHKELGREGHHWQAALNIGSNAGMLLGFGLGILFTSLMLMVFEYFL